MTTNEIQCECGQYFSSRFCPNCGKMRPENGTFTCSCGYTGPISNFCPECGKQRIQNTSAAVTQPAEDNKTEPGAGWTCSNCGATLQTGEKCTECGAEIKQEMLFHISEYTTCIPPRNEAVSVWKFSDTQLIMQHDGKYHFIPAMVIEPAMEIIRKYEIDKWEEYKDKRCGAMGGSQSVIYWDGERIAGSSTDNMPGVAGAYYELKVLFTTA